MIICSVGKHVAFIDKDRNPLYSLCSRYIFGSDGSANILISTQLSVDELKGIHYSKMEMNSIGNLAI